ncbi:MAG: phytanoyl-CoA dioxygenase [Candidatus Latescibacteria bacterium]|nr:phytanoyl-CoA dioxygenase [Candidatus Latescibacterota bacterium]
MSSPNRTVSTSDISQYQRDGAICIRGAFDKEWVDVVTAGVERNVREPSAYAGTVKSGDADAGGFFDDYCNWRRIPEFVNYINDSPAGRQVAALMMSQTAVFYHEHLLIKEPGALKKTPWHHDQPYYPINGRQVCSIWMPLDSVAAETCVQFVRGSHNWGRWFVPRKFATESNYALSNPDVIPMNEGIAYEDVPCIDEHPNDYEILNWNLEPGDCIVFHMLALHGAAGNASLSRSRRVLATRWCGDDARFAGRDWEISPTITGGLELGDPIACDAFPLVWPPATHE